MKVTLLGSEYAIGIPVPICNCKYCREFEHFLGIYDLNHFAIGQHVLTPDDFDYKLFESESHGYTKGMGEATERKGHEV